MNAFIKAVEVRWSDLDPNYHLRHSVYYDYGAYCRICFLEEYGITSMFMANNHLGPILFREEAVFRKEVRIGDKITIDLKLLRARPDHARWTIQHHIFRNEDTIAAILTVDGAWIDTIQRKLTIPIESASAVFEKMPKADKFEWIEK